MWAELAAFLKANTTETLLITIIGTILVWMYKQFKAMIDLEQQNKLTTAQVKQGLFTKLELSIASVLHLNNESSKQHMYTLLGECGPYLTTTQRQVVRDYYKQFDLTVLHSLQALIVSEVDKLDRMLEKIKEKKDTSEWLNYIQRLYAPIGPIILFLVITWYVVFIIMLVKQGATLWVQANLLFFGVVIFIAATLAFGLIYFLVRRELGKQGVKRWIAVATIIFSPVLVFVFNRLDWSIIIFVMQLLGLFVISWGKRPSEIIRV